MGLAKHRAIAKWAFAIENFVKAGSTGGSLPVGVGTPFTRRPLHGSVRALLMHTALTSGQTSKIAEVDKDEGFEHAEANARHDVAFDSTSAWISGSCASACGTRDD